MHLLALPYDVRYQIYRHVFPFGEQIYIQAFRSTLKSITPEHTIPTELLLTCRALNRETSEFLYNNYLFNIIGTKKDCLATYTGFLETVEKHARNKVHIDAFSNGSHSVTMCFSIQAGEGRMPILERRKRGERKGIEELKREVALRTKKPPLAMRLHMPQYTYFKQHIEIITVACCAMMALIVAWLLSF